MVILLLRAQHPVRRNCVFFWSLISLFPITLGREQHLFSLTVILYITTASVPRAG